MVSFIDAHRGRYGVGPVCAEVPSAPSTYYEHKAREGEPERAPGRVRRDGWLSGEIRRVYDEPFEVYGVRKVWRQLRREGVARCTVARLMRRMGLQGAVRGRRVKTTHAPVHSERPDDRVNREFKVSRPNALWVSDLTYVATWRGFDSYDNALASPSSDCTRRNSSPGAGRGVTARRWNSPPSNGCTGTTTGACSNPSDMCLRLNSRHTTTTNCMSRRWPPDSSKSPSGIPGAVQLKSLHGRG